MIMNSRGMWDFKVNLSVWSSSWFSSGALSWQNHADPRQSRVQTDHAGVRLLRRVLKEVRLCHSVEVLHGDLRLPLPVGNHRRQGQSKTKKKTMHFTGVLGVIQYVEEERLCHMYITLQQGFSRHMSQLVRKVWWEHKGQPWYRTPGAERGNIPGSTVEDWGGFEDWTQWLDQRRLIYTFALSRTSHLV